MFSTGSTFVTGNGTAGGGIDIQAGTTTSSESGRVGSWEPNQHNGAQQCQCHQHHRHFSEDFTDDEYVVDTDEDEINGEDDALSVVR